MSDCILCSVCLSCGSSWVALDVMVVAFASLWTRGLPEAEPDVAALLDWARAHEKRLQGIWDVYEYLSVTITLTGVDRNRFMNRLHAEETLAEI